jgi:histidinol-phosphate/aromatic aminotransferase/cobyric acid decarboxylase-like protein
LTKEHAIPGARVGYLLAAPERVRQLDAHRPAWPVSAHAQAAAIAVCGTAPFVRESRRRLLEDRARLASQLRELGLEAVPSTASYLLVGVGCASELRARLLARHAILVRDCSSFGLPGHVRLGARPEADRDRLGAALRQELQR